MIKKDSSRTGLQLVLITVLLLGLVGSLAWYLARDPGRAPERVAFDGARAFEGVRRQVEMGPRIPGTPGHAAAISWMEAELLQAGWSVDLQTVSIQGHEVVNVIGRRPRAGKPWIILGAHYDTRILSDKEPDPALRSTPVPGANDGASGVAVLLELARVLPVDLEKEIWLVFFDAEDNGGIADWEWILGSRAFVENLKGSPEAAIILDMIGDADLNIYLERNSDAILSAAIWAQAAELGYGDRFIPLPRHSILDDHTPFLRAGIPAVDVIDFDYPYHHTTRDTLDKVSAESLQVVGDTMLAWLTADHSSD